jgi:LysM repeat protein
VTEGFPASTTLEPPAPAERDVPDALPSPSILDPNTAPGADVPPLGVVDADDRGKLEGRVAPSLTELITPAPSVRDIEPAATPEPSTLAEKPAEKAAPDIVSTSAQRPAATTPSASKERVVQKGENVIAILKDEYGSSSQRIIDAFRTANKDVKNIDMVIEGQKVFIPALPPEMFEPVAPGGVVLDAAEKSREASLARVEKLINEPRKAPNSAARMADADADRRKDRGKDKGRLKAPAEPRSASRETRVYEVQNKETFSSIAKDQLGSETLWKEIQRLNPKVDPAKMRPGTRLKLPTRRPLADTVAAGRT